MKDKHIMWRKDEEFSAGHRLMNDLGECKNPHGHNYYFDVAIEGKPDENGIIVHSSIFKKAIRSVVDKYDHTFLLAEKDKTVIDFWEKMGWKYHTLTYQPTIEQLVKHLTLEVRENIKEAMNGEVERLYSIKGILDENRRNVGEFEASF